MLSFPRKIESKNISFYVISFFLFFVCFGFIFFFTVYESEIITVDISNSSCHKSIHLGRSYFFHICSKENKNVFDIRYFFKSDQGNLEPYFVGVQMNENEFTKLCKTGCSNE